MASWAPTVFCSLCGLVLSDSSDPALRESGRGWLGAVRAVYTRSSYADTARVSGMGTITGHNVLTICSQTTPDVMHSIALFRNDGADWGYGFHTACWELLLAELGGRVDESAIARALFRQFYCTPCPNSTYLDFGHDYGGALCIGPLGPVSCLDGSPFTFMDPLLVDLSEMEQRASPQPLFSWTCPDLPSNNGPSFSRLPPEILHAILIYLPHADVKQLRLVCRDLAMLARPEELPMAFWRAQFWPGRAYEFLFADTSQKRDWYKAFCGVAWTLRSGDPSLVNRRRIVGLVKQIAALVEFDAAAPSLSLPGGTFLPPLSKEYSPVMLSDANSMADLIYEKTPLSGRRAISGWGSLASDDCREIYTTMAMVPFQGDTKFAVSTVSFGPRTYISGISWMGQAYGGIGYCQSPQNYSQIPPESSVDSLQVTFCARGLIGVKWNFADGTSSPWIGESEGKRTARGILHFRKEPQMAHLVVGLDHYKIVSIGTTYKGVTRPHPVCPPFLTIESNLWVPDVPRREDLFFSGLKPNEAPRGLHALLDIDFGGQSGSLLGSLTRMVVYMSTSPCPITGMEFFYADGSTRSFGSRGQSELSFFLDGPAGERMSEVVIVDDDVQPGLTGFKVITNVGRRMDFVTLRCTHENTSTTWSQKPPYGYVITGFASTSQDDHFFQLGIQSQPAPTRFVYTSSYDFCNARGWPVSMLSRSVCDYHTYASLRRVSRITAFVGTDQRRRLPSDICGLKVDYHDGHAAGAVGQLLEEADSFDICRGESIQTITIWMTSVLPLPPGICNTPRQGKVGATRIETTHGRIANFGPYGPEYPPLDGSDCVRYRYEAKDYDKLTGIAWILNTNYDRVKVLCAWEYLASWSHAVEQAEPKPSSLPPGPIAIYRMFRDTLLMMRGG